MHVTPFALVEEETSRTRRVDVHRGRNDMHFGHQGNHRELTFGERNGVWLARTVNKKTTKERCERSNLEMIVAVPWRKNEDD